MKHPIDNIQISLANKSFADLIYFAGWSKTAAFIISRPSTKAKGKSLNSNAYQLWNSLEVKMYVNKLRQKFPEKEREEEDIFDEKVIKNDNSDWRKTKCNVENKTSDSTRSAPRTREDLILELNEVADNAKDIKQKMDALAKIADLERFKAAEVQTDTEVMRVYLPMKCSECELYKASKLKLLNNSIIE